MYIAKNAIKKVTILLSTYNGETYIEEQLDSLLNQKTNGFEIKIIVRDDGSSDNTIKILKEYEEKYNEKIKVYYKENIGWANSFIELLFLAEKSDFYAFCDQDDIWNQDKILIALDKLQVYQTPALYCCSAQMIDQNKNKLGLFKIPEKFDIENTIIKCEVLGCTQVFNDLLYQELIKITRNSNIPHDWWTICVALSTGIVIADETPHMLYRQTGSNVFGGKGSLLKRISKIFCDNSHKRESIVKMMVYAKIKCDSDFIKYIAEYRRKLSAYNHLLFYKFHNVNFKRRIFFRLYLILGKV